MTESQIMSRVTVNPYRDKRYQNLSVCRFVGQATEA